MHVEPIQARVFQASNGNRRFFSKWSAYRHAAKQVLASECGDEEKYEPEEIEVLARKMFDEDKAAAAQKVIDEAKAKAIENHQRDYGDEAVYGTQPTTAEGSAPGVEVEG